MLIRPNRTLCLFILFISFLLLTRCKGKWKTPLDFQEPDSIGILFTEDFETGHFSSYWRVSGNSPQIDSTLARSGKFSMKTVLDRDTSAIAHRTELAGPEATMHYEYWYGFSIYLPESYLKDKIWEVVAQWHGQPDFDIGEDWRLPVLSLRTERGLWRMFNTWDKKRNTFVDGVPVYGKTEIIELGDYETGTWTDWVIHVRWSYTPFGFLRVWKNGELIIDKTGPNCYNDEKGPYFKMGLYKGWADPDVACDVVCRRVLYHDEFRMAGNAGSYERVMPK
jgi:hypothetical protein